MITNIHIDVRDVVPPGRSSPGVAYSLKKKSRSFIGPLLMEELVRRIHSFPPPTEEKVADDDVHMSESFHYSPTKNRKGVMMKERKSNRRNEKEDS